MTNVCFWTHRGGRFNRGGYKEFIANITDFRQLLNEDPRFTVNGTDDDGNPLPGDEWYIDDGGGNEILRGRAAIEAHTGVLDIDGVYDTREVKDIDDCTPDEWDILLDWYKNGGEMDDDVRAAVLENFGLLEITGATATNIRRNDDDDTVSCTVTVNGEGKSVEIGYYMGDEYDGMQAAIGRFADDAEEEGFDPIDARRCIEDLLSHL